MKDKQLSSDLNLVVWLQRCCSGNFSYQFSPFSALFRFKSNSANHFSKLMELEFQMNQLIEGLNIGCFWKVWDEMRAPCVPLQMWFKHWPWHPDVTAVMSRWVSPNSRVNFTPAQLSEQLRSLWSFGNLHKCWNIHHGQRQIEWVRWKKYGAYMCH